MNLHVFFVVSLILLVGATGHAQFGFNTWEPTNGPLGGDVQHVAVYPSDPNKILASTDAGIFLTTNGGGNWRSLLTGYAEAIHVAPTTPNAILVVSQSGISKSTDDGMSWSVLVAPRVHSLVTGPQGPSWLYAGGDSGNVHVSSNGGMSWQTYSVGSAWAIRAIAILPSSNVIFAGTEGNWDFPGDGAFRSIDGGLTWSNSALPNKSIACIAIDPSNPSTAYAGTRAGGMYRGSGIFKSTDTGNSWLSVGVGLPYDSSVVALLVNPSVPQQIYAALWYDGLYKSENGGASWFHVNANVDEGYTWCLATAPSDAQRVFVGTIFGLLQGTYSSSALDLIGVHRVGIASVAVDQTYPNVAYAIGRGVHKTSDGGETWKFSNRGMGLAMALGEVIVIDPSNPAVLYAGQYQPNGAVYKSTDRGTRWTTTPLRDVAINAIAVHPVTRDLIYAGGLLDPHVIGMFRSTNGGASWDTLRSGLVGGAVTAIALNQSEPTAVYIGTSNAGVLKSTDRGGSWFQVNQGLPVPLEFVGDIVTDPYHPDTSYVAFAGTQGVYRTTNGGESWESASNGLIIRDVRALAFDHTEPSTVFAGTRGGGVFARPSAGVSWSQMNNGGSVASITSFSLCPQRMLYCGTPGDGVWRYQFLICSAGDASNPTQAALMQNYPNPFNPTTTIRFTVPATVGTGPAGIALAGRHALSLRVYDVLGREVATLVNEVKQPGTYTVQWDASEVASGVYLYQLRAGGFVQTKKLMVLR